MLYGAAFNHNSMVRVREADDGKGAACTTVDEDLGAMQSEAGAAEADRDGGER